MNGKIWVETYTAFRVLGNEKYKEGREDIGVTNNTYKSSLKDNLVS